MGVAYSAHTISMLPRVNFAAEASFAIPETLLSDEE